MNDSISLTIVRLADGTYEGYSVSDRWNLITLNINMLEYKTKGQIDHLRRKLAREGFRVTVSRPSVSVKCYPTEAEIASLGDELSLIYIVDRKYAKNSRNHAVSAQSTLQYAQM